MRSPAAAPVALAAVALAAVLPLLVLATAGAALADAPALRDPFGSAREVPALRAVATQRDVAGNAHRLELVRDAAAVCRRTDERLELCVERGAEEDGYRVVDHRRRAVMTVSRSGLHRLGVFPDRRSLGSLVPRPAGRFEVRASERAPLKTEAGKCRWLRVEPERGAALEVCWSDRWALALRVEAEGAAAPLVEVHQVAKAPAASARTVPAGYALVDADEELETAGD